MKSNQYHEHPHIKREILSTTTTTTSSPLPPPLKINSHSHFIKKPPPPPPAPSAVATKPFQRRQPVIIYTHSPKIIHTHPRDFMALVQKLTGLSGPEIDPPTGVDAAPSEEEETKPGHRDRLPQPATTAGSDESDTATVITEEHYSSIDSSVGIMQAINSDFMSGPPPSFPVFDPPNPCFSNMPLFPNDNLSQAATAPFYNNYYADSDF